jgi:charged multivesicular body protein 5
MQSAKKTLEKQYKEMNIDKVEKMYDDMQSLMEDMDEIQEIMGRSYTMPEDVDEDELLEELDSLQDNIGEDNSYLNDLDVEIPNKSDLKQKEKVEMNA